MSAATARTRRLPSRDRDAQQHCEPAADVLHEERGGQRHQVGEPVVHTVHGGRLRVHPRVLCALVRLVRVLEEVLEVRLEDSTSTGGARAPRGGERVESREAHEPRTNAVATPLHCFW